MNERASGETRGGFEGGEGRARPSRDCDARKNASMMMMMTMMMMRRMRVMGGAVTDEASRERARAVGDDAREWTSRGDGNRPGGGDGDGGRVDRRWFEIRGRADEWYGALSRTHGV